MKILSAPDANLTFPHLAFHRRILIADDNEFVRMSYGAILDSGGHHIDFAKNGQEALEQLSNSDFDLLITDREMPQMDGVALIRKLRARGNRIPIVMISGSLADSPLPADVAGEVAVALPKPAPAREILAAATYALSPQERTSRGWTSGTRPPVVPMEFQPSAAAA
jgi:CheY-like chemotaxis protein